MHHNDFFRIYDGHKSIAETYRSGSACDHADAISFHGGKPRIVLVTNQGEKEVSHLPIDRKNHVCDKHCKF